VLGASGRLKKAPEPVVILAAGAVGLVVKAVPSP